MAENTKKKKTKKICDYYEIKNNKLIRKLTNCPRCGAGTYLAEHADRLSCGKCGYTEWKK